MSNSLKTPDPPKHGTFDELFEKEESRVRSRLHRPGSGRGARRTALPPPLEHEPVTERRYEAIAERMARIEAKIARAAILLKTLPPADARARLLNSAILRRDEVLLDAVLEADVRSGSLDRR